MLGIVATSPRARWGWGPSDLASQEEKDAWQAMRVGRAIEAGQATVAQLPEAYGGRPTGSSRRAIRQQQAWEAEQAAILKQQQEARQIEEFQKNQRIKDLTIEEKEYDFRTKREDALFEKNEETKIKAAEARLAEFANTLDPTDPTSASLLAAEIENDPYLLNSPLAAKRYDYFTKAASNSVQVIEGQQRKAVDSVVSAALQAGMSAEDIARFKTLDDQNRETYDVGGLQRAMDIVIGERTVAAEERKEPEDKRSPQQKAQDQLADSRARLSAYVEDVDIEEGAEFVPLDQESEGFRKAVADFQEAKSRVERLSKSEKPKPKSNLPSSGEVRDGFRYTGPSNDKKAASNPDNWVRE
jgi:hypothetical protein